MESRSELFLDLSNLSFTESALPETESARPRRALIFTESVAGAALRQQLADAGYETLIASVNDVAQTINKFAPDVALIDLGRQGSENDRIAAARRLRAEPATYALPIVLLFHADMPSLRNAALNIGVDDYLAIATPPAQILARLDALFWRAEAGRRAAPIVGEQRAEIDNFLHVFDSMVADLESGATGTLALVEAVERREDFSKDAQSRTLTEAHGFLKLNLRRVDAVTFYGPTTLLVYLSRYGRREAHAALTRLREEFLETRADSDIAVGLVSFPADGSDVEGLIIKAEEAVDTARAHTAQTRIVAYQASEAATKLVLEKMPPTKQTEKSDEMPRWVVEEAATSPKLSEKKLVRETKGGDALEISITPPANTGAKSGDAEALARAAMEAAAHERELRTQGAIMPRRLLLAVSDPARMAQLNLLLRSAGYEVRAAFDGPQALNLLRIERADLLLLDYELSGIDGIEAVRRLHKQGVGRLPLPALLLLPAQHENMRREALALGVRDIIWLPYDPAELLRCVRVSGRAE